MMRWFNVVLGGLILAMGWAMSNHPALADQPGLETLPELHLDDAAAPVRETVEEARTRLERVLADDVADATLAEAWGHFADVSFAHELIAHARVAYGNAIALRPGRQEWHYLLGLVEVFDGNYQAGIESLSRALEIYEDDYAALIHRGRARLEAGQLEQAEEDFTTALQLAPESAAAAGGLGRVALQREEYEKAIERLQRALNLDPAASRLHELLGNAYLGLGDEESARAHMDRRGDAVETVRDPTLSRVQGLSRSPQFYLETGLAHAEAGDMGRARAMLMRAAELDPDNAAIQRELGEVTARMGALDEAYEIFSGLVERDPDDAELQFYLGQIEELRGNTEHARAAYEQALAIDRELLDAQVAMAHLQLQAGEAVDAAQAFDRLAGQTSGNRSAQMLYWRGISELAGGDCATATRSFNRARDALEGRSGPVLTALARIRASCGDADEAALREAAEWAEMLYGVEPGLETAVTLAMVMAALGEFDEAIDFQAQAMFEALRDGYLDDRPTLQENMARYRDGRRAEEPFGSDDPVFTGMLSMQ
jgi:tetratricopeptide (TPR) repeat protein